MAGALTSSPTGLQRLTPYGVRHEGVRDIPLVPYYISVDLLA